MKQCVLLTYFNSILFPLHFLPKYPSLAHCVSLFGIPFFVEIKVITIQKINILGIEASKLLIFDIQMALW